MATNFSSTLDSFYLACCNNQVTRVKQYLLHLSVNDINQRHTDGNTALHIACLYGYTEIVRLLLKKGASNTVLNNEKCKPIDVAKTSAIKALFARPATNPQATRFVAPLAQLEWNFSTDHAKWYCKYSKSSLASHDITLDETVSRILTDREVQKFEKMEEVIDAFEQCQATQDFNCILKAYTCESDFYNKLNKALAREDGVVEKEDVMKRWDFVYAASILNRPDLKVYQYRGISYRGMWITSKDADSYKAGAKMYNKSFLSTSQKIEVAEKFLCTNEDSRGIPVICIYYINTSRIALDIKKWSRYPDEEEVLILPYTPFKIKKTRRDGERMRIKIESL
jgi:hypothetical protein